jgi:hypothetical protein
MWQRVYWPLAAGRNVQADGELRSGEMGDAETAGIDGDALWRFVEEQIYSLPGTSGHRDVFTILLTGSRGAGIHTPASDIDIDVVCPQPVYESVQRAALGAGIIRSRQSFWFVLRGDGWDRYYGKEMGRPHFSLTGLDDVADHFRRHEDVHIWIWTNAQVLADPQRQFQRIREAWQGYPPDVLVRKIKYRWLLAGFWDVEVYPYHHARDDELLAASSAIVNSVNELLRLFFLVEGKSFPYTEKLMRLAPRTELGRQFAPMLQQIVGLAVGERGAGQPAWERLDRAHEMLCMSDTSAECRELEEACAKAMIAAGVDAQWVEADYDNVDELLLGRLGPVP